MFLRKIDVMMPTPFLNLFLVWERRDVDSEEVSSSCSEDVAVVVDIVADVLSLYASVHFVNNDSAISIAVSHCSLLSDERL